MSSVVFTEELAEQGLAAFHALRAALQDHALLHLKEANPLGQVPCTFVVDGERWTAFWDVKDRAFVKLDLVRSTVLGGSIPVDLRFTVHFDPDIG